MSLHNTESSLGKSSVIKIPSKTFLIGEYAVLSGHKALVMTHEPYFTCSLASGESKEIKFHKDSPAGKLEIDLSGTQKTWNFKDPHSGSGGFGGSTAEFIGVYKTLKPDGDLADLTARYFSIFENKKTPPSGADLVAQYNERTSYLVYRKRPFESAFYKWPFKEVGCLTLKTDLKLATHEHLDAIEESQFDKLGKASDTATDCFIKNDFSGFISAVEMFSSEESKLGLLAESTEATARLISKIDGVYAARGCGAMGADVITVFVKKERIDYVWKQIDELDRGLRKV